LKAVSQHILVSSVESKQGQLGVNLHPTPPVYGRVIGGRDEACSQGREYEIIHYGEGQMVIVTIK